MVDTYVQKQTGIMLQQQRYNSAVKGKVSSMTSPISRGAYTNTSPSMGIHTKVAYGIAPPQAKQIKVLGLSKKSTIVETSNTRGLLTG